ncbi:MAG: P1 family peptidase [Chloroflexales bacterium]|nr:P1 family peptidase [Chloroflexales bacterium]
MPPTITDVPGILVGHAHDTEALTGCTVVLAPDGAVGAVDVRGGGPGTRETDLLAPTAMVSEVHGIALCGGSAFGLAAATGVVEWLREHGIGYDVRVARVPIVPAAVIFDLTIGRSDRWADAAMGYTACTMATTTVAEGCVGVGIGATVGKMLGPIAAVKSGVGVWSETLADGTVLGALAVCNAFGDVWREGGGIIAGARNLEQGGFADATRLLRTPEVQQAFAGFAANNTTLAIVATNASLDKAMATKLAQMAQDGLARTIRPVHTPLDGDTVFVLSTGQRPAPHLAILGSIAADVLAHAIERCVTETTSIGGLPAARDL